VLEVVGDGGLTGVFVAEEPEPVMLVVPTVTDPEATEEEPDAPETVVVVPLLPNGGGVVVATLLVEQDVVVEVKIVVVTVALKYELEPVPTIALDEEVEVGAAELEMPVVQPGSVKKGPNSLCTIQAFSQAPSPAVVELS